MIESLCRALPRFCRSRFNVDDDTPSFTEDNLLAVKIIEVFRHLLARGSYNTGKNFVTDI